jgi:hypothetical protein
MRGLNTPGSKTDNDKVFRKPKNKIKKVENSNFLILGKTPPSTQTIN